MFLVVRAVSQKPEHKEKYRTHRENRAADDCPLFQLILESFRLVFAVKGVGRARARYSRRTLRVARLFEYGKNQKQR